MTDPYGVTWTASTAPLAPALDPIPWTVSLRCLSHPSFEDTLAHAVIDKYGNNVRIVGALAKQYGFKSLFYWQPTIFQKRHLTEYESSWHQEVRPIEPFFLSTYAALGRRMGDIGRHSPIVDLSEIFADVKVPLYVDWCHLAEGGNVLIAKRMAGDIALLLGSR